MHALQNRVINVGVVGVLVGFLGVVAVLISLESAKRPVSPFLGAAAHFLLATTTLLLLLKIHSSFLLQQLLGIDSAIFIIRHIQTRKFLPVNARNYQFSVYFFGVYRENLRQEYLIVDVSRPWTLNHAALRLAKHLLLGERPQF
jgi:hypothetical protein